MLRRAPGIPTRTGRTASSWTTIEGDELEGAGRIAILTKALADAERAAAAEKAAFDNAKARNAAAKKTLKAAADSVTQAQKDIVSRVKGAGDSVAIRLANKVSAAQRAYTSAEEDRVEAAAALAKDRDDLRKAETELAGAQSDASARSRYDTLMADDGAADDDIQKATIALADAAKRVAAAETAVGTAKAAVKTSDGALNARRTGKAAVAAARKGELADAQAAQSSTYNFEDGNPVSALVDEMLKPDDDNDRGGALVEALDETWDTTQDNAVKIADNMAKIKGLDTGAIGENTVKISNNADAIGGLDGRVGANETAIGGHETRISANEATIVEHETRIAANRTGHRRQCHGDRWTQGRGRAAWKAGSIPTGTPLRRTRRPSEPTRTTSPPTRP